METTAQTINIYHTGKIRITSDEHAKEVQEALFAQGYSHVGGRQGVRTNIYGLAWYGDCKLIHTTQRRSVFVHYLPKDLPGLHFNSDPQTKNPKTKTLKKTDNVSQAVVKALGYVSTQGYNLSDSSTSSARAQRLRGWALFCCCMKIIYPEFTVRGISDAITVKNAPAKETFPNIIENCWETAKESPRVLRAKIEEYEKTY